MNPFDVKTLISSGTMIVAVVLFLVFNNTTKEETMTDDRSITAQYAVEVTGNELIEAKYVSINDGDTFRVNVEGEENRVRLLMVDTPEMNYEENDPMPFAEEAKQYTKTLLENANKIELLFDVGPEADKYGRLLTYVFVDDLLLQEALLKEGYAAVRFVHKPNNTLEQELLKIQLSAKERGINIWENADYLQNDGFHPEVITGTSN